MIVSFGISSVIYFDLNLNFAIEVSLLYRFIVFNALKKSSDFNSIFKHFKEIMVWLFFWHLRFHICSTVLRRI